MGYSRFLSMVVELVSWAIVIVWVPYDGGRASFMGYSGFLSMVVELVSWAIVDSLVQWSS